VSLAVGHVATRRGNRLGVLAFGGREPRIMRPRQGRLGLLALLAELRHDPEGDGAGATSLGTALGSAAALSRQRGLVVIVSDFRGERDWEGPLQALRARHGVMAVEVVDPREQQLVNAGDLWLVDAETGRQVHVDTRKRRIRDRFAAAAAAEREEPQPPLARPHDPRLTAAERQHAQPVAAACGHVADGQRHALGDVGLAPVRGPERHRGGDVEHEPGRQRPLTDVHAHVRLLEPRRRHPVDVAYVVTRVVRADHLQLGALAGLRRQVLARHERVDLLHHREIQGPQDRGRNGPGTGARRRAIGFR